MSTRRTSSTPPHLKRQLLLCVAQSSGGRRRVAVLLDEEDEGERHDDHARDEPRGGLGLVRVRAGVRVRRVSVRVKTRWCGAWLFI